ncbi:MAG: 2TM domain-containing protein [Flavobacteriaceae bacterium]|nr:2TM domain-containing protein [Flavobacteriaceae bacterium]
MEDYIEEDNYLRAKKKVEKLKGFYWHLAFYLGVNLFISVSKIVNNLSDGETFMEAFGDFGTFAVWIFWGIGIFFHAMGVFGQNIFFGKDWEERKIKELMDEDTNHHKSFKP